ncbi:NAD(P)H-binding protein [Intrasporangium sp.]|uniref:NAD(P)H-binding protein n=1 Tax=Intrasporangium sp. TaxID=1925024 RepID=UPI003221CFAE
MRVLVAGATGFVGRRLCRALVDAGHEVVAMTRHPADYSGPGVPVHGDVHAPDSLPGALSGDDGRRGWSGATLPPRSATTGKGRADAAYYLVHSLDAPDFARRDAAAAQAFGEAAGEAGVRRIVYLGGLGDDADALSAHLRSRRAVEGLLGAGGVPVTTLRAGIIVGHGGISWELTRQLVQHLPVMVTPTWVRTRTQPIAIDDVVRYLVAALTLPLQGPRAFEIGGPEVLQYVTMLRRVATIEHRPLLVLPVPLLSPGLSSWWLALVTDVDTATGRALVDSMTNEVVVRDDAIRALVPFEPMSYDQAVRQALRERAQEGDRE